MKYLVAEFSITGATDGATMAAARDVVAALAADSGFEAFEETATGVRGYVRRSLLDEVALRCAIDTFPFPGLSVAYRIEAAEDRDWNAAWETAGFEPIDVGGHIAIHDTLHSAPTCDIDITIDARQAFGTGTHHTTRMIVEWLADNAPLTGKRVLDCGCGTGILSIAASKLGARDIVAYDIDEWSVNNTRHNAELNDCRNITVMHGDASLLPSLTAPFDIILANLNRNILIADMAAMQDVVADKGILVTSGFYDCDCDILAAKAEALGMICCERRADNSDGWAMMVLTEKG